MSEVPLIFITQFRNIQGVLNILSQVLIEIIFKCVSSGGDADTPPIFNLISTQANMSNRGKKFSEKKH